MKRRTLLLAVLVLLVVIGAGAAFAYWTTHGAGTGAGSAGTLQAVTVDAFVGGDTPSSALIPGGTADVILRVKNLNAFPVTLVTVSGNGAITADAGHSGCSGTPVTFSNRSGLTVAIAAFPTTTLVHLAGAASMSTSAVSACQGATFTIPVSITVHSS